MYKNVGKNWILFFIVNSMGLDEFIKLGLFLQQKVNVSVLGKTDDYRDVKLCTVRICPPKDIHNQSLLNNWI